MFFQSDNLQKLIRTINRNQNEVTNYKHMYSRRIINIWKHFQCALPILSYYSIQINNKNTLISTSVYFSLNEFKDGSWITKMGWATKLSLAENRKQFIPSRKRTMIWSVLDVFIRFQLSILFCRFIDTTLNPFGEEIRWQQPCTNCQKRECSWWVVQ